jgi:hypothetical protein
MIRSAVVRGMRRRALRAAGRYAIGFTAYC